MRLHAYKECRAPALWYFFVTMNEGMNERKKYTPKARGLSKEVTVSE